MRCRQADIVATVSWPVSLTLVNSLLPVSLAPAINTKLRASPRIFVKILNSPIGIINGPGETDS